MPAARSADDPGKTVQFIRDLLPSRNDHIRVEPHQLCRQFGKPPYLPLV
jgi:hypothetical protein